MGNYLLTSVERRVLHGSIQTGDLKPFASGQKYLKLQQCSGGLWGFLEEAPSTLNSNAAKW